MSNNIDEKKYFENIKYTRKRVSSYQDKINEYNKLIYQEQLKCSHEHKITIKNSHRNSDKDYYICQCLCCNARFFIEKDDDLLLDERIIHLDEYIDADSLESIIDEKFEIDLLQYIQKNFDELVLKCPNNFTFSKEYIIQYIKKIAESVGNNLNERKRLLEQPQKQLKK